MNLLSYFIFKIVSKSLFFRVYEIKVKAFKCTNINNVNGYDNQTTPIEIKYNSLSVLERFNYKHYFQDILRSDRNLTSRTDYAAQFFTSEDLRTMIDNNHSVEFQIIAKHSLTGFSRVKTMRYINLYKVKDGKFLSGNSFKIVEPEEELVLNT
jgi:hypothetical protein